MTNCDPIRRLMNSSHLWFADGGLETELVYHYGQDLPFFASFPLLETEAGRAVLRDYFDRFLRPARGRAAGFVLDTATWRAGVEWGARLGLSKSEIASVNMRAAEFAREIRDGCETEEFPIIVNGVIGPSGDGYVVGAAKSAEQSQASHAPQIEALVESGVDLVSAITMTYSDEAIGIAVASLKAGVPVVVSFTVETDGRLPSGETIGEAISRTDQSVFAAVGDKPLYYMINCAHPDHFKDEIQLTANWKTRIGGIRANASRLSHAELDAATTLDDGDPEDFGRLYAGLQEQLPNLRVIGGCCGTDDRHVFCAGRHTGRRRQAA